MSHRKRQACCSMDNAMKNGVFRRVSDGRYCQRYRCKTCGKSFSQATYDPAYYQKKRQCNYPLMICLSSAVSMRRTAIITRYFTNARYRQFKGKKGSVHGQGELKNGARDTLAHLCRPV